ncbi:hypothetical protein EXIGLDRAFT_840118 [Exidia glandulosa HHB12029]|uniref:BTB domain-containing protein n=1 Tax=Exidia glandulosa HHB12029 TaxID=1314781 RepID=A0A165ZZV6_EXIGL|nr:hypothetical protein EXIGLDRAFT_840118 [Exidia glandulosa HHB12029]
MLTRTHTRSASFSSTSTLPTVYEDSSRIEREPDFIKEDELWFDDGDIILVARDRDYPPALGLQRAFKVHQHVLERQSVTWLGVLVSETITPSKNVPLLYEDVPVVEIPDRAEDLYHYLQWTYNIGYLGHFSLASWLDDGIEDCVESLLRMAECYEVPSLRRDIEDFLEREWPSNLAMWDKQERAVQEKIRDEVIEEYCAGPDALRAIDIAREYDLPQILTAAFYHLNRVLTFPSSQPDSDPSCTKILTPQSVVHFPSSLHIELSTPDLLRLLRARSFFQSSISIWALQFQPQCSPRGSYPLCALMMSEWWQTKYRDRLVCGMHVESLDPLAVLREAVESLEDEESEETEGMCGGCRERLRSVLVERREMIWDSLPKWFDVDVGLDDVQNAGRSAKEDGSVAT